MKTIALDETVIPKIESATKRSAWKNTNLQLYFSGQFVSFIGTSMQQIALSWLVYHITGSPAMLGLIAFTSQAPTFLVTPFAGILADRGNRHHLLIITQIFQMGQAACLTAVASTCSRQRRRMLTFVLKL